MDRTTRTNGTLSLPAGRTPARLLAVAATTTAALLAVLGCASGGTLITPAGNKTIPGPTATLTPVAMHEVAVTATLNGGQTGPVVATCPAGELAITGGWDVPPTTARVFAAGIAGNGWSVSVLPLGHPATTTVTAYVECLHGAGGRVTAVQRTTTKTFAPTVFSNDVDNAAVFIGNCQTGEGLAGFGFDFGAAAADKLELEASVPSEVLHAQTWSFRVWNHDTVAHDASFTLQCLTTTGSGTVHYTAQKGTGLYANMSATTAVDCPAGTMVAGGGFAYALVGQRASYLGNEFSQHVTATGWQSSMIAFTSDGLVPVYPQVAAVCMTLA